MLALELTVSLGGLLLTGTFTTMMGILLGVRMASPRSRI